MSNYRQVLSEFTRLGYNENSRLDEYEVNSAMDKICQANARTNGFNREIATELWEHTEKGGDGKVQTRDYVTTIIEAHRVLDENIKKSEEMLTYTNDPNERNELQDGLEGYVTDYK